MKKYILPSTMAFVLAAACISPSSVFAATAWQNVGTPGFSAGLAGDTSIAFPAGSTTPYVAYVDAGNSGKATVMKFDGTSWEAVGSAGFSAGSVNYMSLAFPTGSTTPYVVYEDDSNSSKATVMKFDGTSWVTVGTAGFSAGAVQYTTIAFDSNGTPYIGYVDVGNGNFATVMKFDGTSWVTVGTAGFSADTVDHTSLAIDSNDTPYLAFTDNANGNAVTAMQFNGTSWEIVGSAGMSAGGAGNTSIAFATGSTTPYVAYQEGNSNGYKATVMKFDGTSWEAVGTASLSPSEVNYPYIAFSTSSTTPYVVYEDQANSNHATVMKFNGTSWEAVGTAGFSAGIAQYTTIAFDSSGTPYVAYKDLANSNKATVMSYRIVLAAPTVTTQAASSIGQTSVVGNGTITDTGGESTTVRGFVYGETAAYGATTTESGSFSTGAFTATLSGLTCNTDYHYAAYAVNSIGTSTEPDATFTTSACSVDESPAPSRRSSGGSVQSQVKNLEDMGNTAAAEALKAQWPNLFGSKGTSVSGSVSGLSVRDLTIGLTGEDVRALQKLLNANGYQLAGTGPGAPGSETTTFGARTRAALAKYQAANNVLPSVGYFGPLTRASMKTRGFAGLWW